MTELLAATSLILASGLCVALWTLKNHRENRKHRGLLRPWPIPVVALEDLDPRFRATPLGPLRATEIHFIASHRVAGGISDLETWILCVLAQDASRVFEFGTATGKTTYLLARNAPPDARITTLTLRSKDLTSYRKEKGDTPESYEDALGSSRFERFFYQGTDVESKIDQIFGDSKAFDEDPYIASCDMIFVDGSHARSYVESDSRKALRMVKPGGIVLWHDYWGPRRANGVFEALNALARGEPLVHIAGTSLVAYRSPPSV